MTSISDRIREVLDRVGWDVPTSIVVKDKALSDLTVRQIRNGLGNTKTSILRSDIISRTTIGVCSIVPEEGQERRIYTLI